MVNWEANALSVLALALSCASLIVSFADLRVSGPRVTFVRHVYSVQDDGRETLKVVIANAGRADINLDEAVTSWFGPAATDFPTRLLSNSSLALTFVGRENAPVWGRGPLNVTVQLGNGESFSRRLSLGEDERGLLNERWLRAVPSASGLEPAKQVVQPTITIEEV